VRCKLKIQPKHLLLGLTLSVAGTFAASTYIANNQPFGYIGPSALSSASFESGNTLAYATWFDPNDYKGNIIAYPMSAAGIPNILNPAWNAQLSLETQGWDNRKVVTTTGFYTAGGVGDKIKFRWWTLHPDQFALFGGDKLLLQFIRGNRDVDGTALAPRIRGSLLGDIIHSNPVYVQKPTSAISSSDYMAFLATHKDRPSRVYVGANDGMLHSFDGETGTEIFAYIPSMIFPKLMELTRNPYTHQYMVDGPLTASDAKWDDAWHSVLVGGLGAGGKGYFAVDITDASPADEQAAADNILWEFHTGRTGAANLGYGYSRASVAKGNNDKWHAYVANGYYSASGAASLYVLDISDGSVIREMVVPDAAANGLSSPTLIDADSDDKVDIAYAGDRNGNLWRFDLSDADPANWVVAYANRPLFQTAIAGVTRQPITTAPEVGRHPTAGYMVYVATGELLDTTQGTDTQLQAIYGVWDNDWAAGQMPVAVSELQRQEYTHHKHPVTGAAVRTATNNAVDWTVKKGWATPLLVSSPATLDYGEKVLQNITLRDDRIQFVTVNPVNPSGENWFLQLNAYTGGAPTKTVVDADKNKVLTLADNVDGDGDDLIKDTALDRVIGAYLGFGLSSGPTVGGNQGESSTSLFNHIEAIKPVTTLTFPDEPGLIGGHFDLDTSHGIYKFGQGTTDHHVHEWDDKNDLTTIDYFDMTDGLTSINKFNGQSVPTGDTPFFLTVSNTVINTSGVMEINGSSFSAVDYFALQTRWVEGTLAAGETFPTYILNPPTETQRDAGLRQLKSFKLSFDAFSIIKGELLGTNTGCVRGNDIGIHGEYRNGAITMQALDAEGFAGFTYDAVNDVYIAANTAMDGTHQYARVHPNNDTGANSYFGQSMFWESTVFWHWDGDCYGQGNWQSQYDACLAQTSDSFCWVASDAEQDKAEKTKDGDKDKDKETTTVPDPDVVEDVDPADHRLEAIITADSSKQGRLYWRELIPD
jgi:hypothetical protein